jgi:hypothetical protein
VGLPRGAQETAREEEKKAEEGALFTWLIIRLIQLIFLAETVFFSHKKSTNSVF